MENEERLLDDWHSSWLEYVDNNEAPLIYHKWIGVSMIASVIERKAYIQWEGDLYPNFYIVLVGPPGCRKGSAMRPGRDILDTIGVNIAANATTKEKLVDRLEKTVSGTDVDKEGNLLTYSALTVYSEEFTVFLRSKDPDFLAWLSEWYDCGKRFTYDTKSRNTNTVVGVWVNLIGATTPELLRDSIPRESFGGGLNSRIIYVYASKKGKVVLFPFMKKKENPELEYKLTRDLEAIRTYYSGEYKPDETYLKRWEEWYPTQDQDNFGGDEFMAGYVNRRPTHVHKLAMVFNASRMGDMILTSVDFDRAIELLTTTERHMKQTFAGVGQSQLSAVIQRVLSYIITHKQATRGELLRLFYNDADDQQMAVILATLENAKLIEIGHDKEINDYVISYSGKD